MHLETKGKQRFVGQSVHVIVFVSLSQACRFVISRCHLVSADFWKCPLRTLFYLCYSLFDLSHYKKRHHGVQEVVRNEAKKESCKEHSGSERSNNEISKQNHHMGTQ